MSCSTTARAPSGTVAVRRVGGHEVAGHRRQGGRLELRRHAHAAAARARAAAAPPESEAAGDPRPRQRRDPRLGADATRWSARTCSRSRRKSSKPRGCSTHENHRALDDPRTRLIVGDGRTHLLLTPRALRRHRLGAVEPVDGRDRVALHPRILPGGARPAGAGRRALPVGAHLRHQHQRSAVDRRDVRGGVSGRHALAHRRRRRAARRDRTSRSSRASTHVDDGWQRPGVADGPRVGRGQRTVPDPVAVRRARARVSPSGPAARRSSPTTGRRWSSPVRRARSAAAVPTTRKSCAAMAEGAGTRPAAVERALAAATPAAWRDRGLMLLSADASRPAYTDFVTCHRGQPERRACPRGLDRSVGTAAPAGRHRRAARPAWPPTRRTWPRRVALSRFLASQGQYDEAVRIMLERPAGDTGNVAALEQLASVLVGPGRRRAHAPGGGAAARRGAVGRGHALLLGGAAFMENRTALALVEAATRAGHQPEARQGAQPRSAPAWRAWASATGPARRSRRRLPPTPRTRRPTATSRRSSCSPATATARPATSPKP